MFFPHDLIVLGLLVFPAIAGVVSLAIHRQRLSGWLVPSLLWVTIYPLMLVIYHGDAIELERHSYQLALQLRMGAWIGLIFLLDQEQLSYKCRVEKVGLNPIEA